MSEIQTDNSMIVIIEPTNSLEDLELQWNNYQSLPIQLMQHSDDAAIAKYGSPNRTLYERLKAFLLLTKDDYVININNANRNSIMSEGFIIDDVAERKDPELLNNIKKAIELNSDTMVVMYPVTPEFMYTLEDLSDMFERFNMLSQDLKRLSDQECMSLFGMNNLNMYARSRNDLLNLIDLAPEIFDQDYIQEIDTSLNNYFSVVHNTKNGLLKLLEKKLELVYLKKYGALTESTMAEDSLARIDTSINKERQLSDSVPEFVPFFVPTEIEDLMGEELTEEDKAYIDTLKSNLATGYSKFNSEEYYKELKEVSQSDSQSYNINMIRKGWNPNIPFTNESFKFARERQINYLNEYYKINIVDMTNQKIGDVLTEGKTNDITFTFKPVFLVIGLDVCYISIEPELTWLYSEEKDPVPFNLVADDVPIHVYCAFVDDSAFIELKKHINDGRYNYPIFNDLRNAIGDEKRLCSVFIDVIGALTNLERVNDPKVYYIYSGDKLNYTADLIMPTLNAIMSDSFGLMLRKMSAQDVMRKIADNPSVTNYKMIRCNESETELNDILEQISFLNSPNSVVTEAKSIPIRFNSKGVVIDLPTRIEEEYQTVHKALTVYEKEKNYEAMKDPLAHLWYLNLLCERKINKIKDNEKKTDKLKVNRDTRARILNDFKKYLKLVISEDKEFDFTSYFAKSKYNDRSIFVNSDTLRYTGKAIATIVKSLITKQH